MVGRTKSLGEDVLHRRHELLQEGDVLLERAAGLGSEWLVRPGRNIKGNRESDDVPGADRGREGR